MVADFESVNHMAKHYADDVRQAMPVDKAILFGSYANGSATGQSDVDICFFLDNFDGRRRIDILKELLGLTRGYKGIYFEPTVFPTSEIKNGNPFVKEILRTGREI
jgi:predicted nucleotidyltransferase